MRLRFPRNNALPVNTGGGVWRSPRRRCYLDPDQSARNRGAKYRPRRVRRGQAPLPARRECISAMGIRARIANAAHFYRSDDVATGAPVITDITTPRTSTTAPANAGMTTLWFRPLATLTLCISADRSITTPTDFTTDGRGVLYSTDAGASFTDMTWDANFKPTPAGIVLPAQSRGAERNPSRSARFGGRPRTPGLFFEGSDGGLMRSNGSFSDISGAVHDLSRALRRRPGALPAVAFARAAHALQPQQGLSTLQFQGISVDPQNVRYVQGGTQDNGTWITNWSAGIFAQEIYGDGGQSGFSSTNSNLRFNSFTGNFSDVNFNGGDPLYWVIATGPIFASSKTAQFYPPVIADPSPAAGGTISRVRIASGVPKIGRGGPASLSQTAPNSSLPVPTRPAVTSCRSVPPERPT